MKALLIIFSLLLVLLLAGLWGGSGSYPERWKTEQRINAQEEQNEQRQKEIDGIKADLKDVASGDGAIEERARSELGMTKENESFFEIILAPDNKKESVSADPMNEVKVPVVEKSDIQTNEPDLNGQQKEKPLSDKAITENGQ